MSLRGNSSQGHPSAHELGCQAHLDTSALRLHLVPKWVQRASPAPVWHRAGAAGRAGETLLICFEIGLPEMCLRQMLQSQLYGTGSRGQGLGTRPFCCSVCVESRVKCQSTVSPQVMHQVRWTDLEGV